MQTEKKREEALGATVGPRLALLAPLWHRLRRRLPFVDRVWGWVRRPVFAIAGTLLRRGVRLALPTGAVVRLHPAFASWSVDRYEPELVRWIVDHLGPGDVFVDVGAHVGFFTLAASGRVGDTGRVVAIEASPATCQLLRRHVGMNRRTNVTVVQALAGRAAGLRAFRYHHRATDPSACANSLAHRADDERVAQVQVVTLDDLCAGLGVTPRVIKIDVEGAEFAVLRGSESLLRRVRPVVACAIHPDALESLGDDANRLLAWMSDLGYRCADLAGRPVAQAGFEEILFLPARTGGDV